MWTISKKKQLWWAVLFYASGGFLLLATCLIGYTLEGDRTPLTAWIICAATAGLVVLSGVSLRKLYRQEPFAGPGVWQLSIIDLMGAVFVCAVLLAIWKTRHGKHFVTVGIPLCLAVGVTYVIGLLVATRRAVKQSAWKAIYAGGFVGRWLGSLGVGALLVSALVWTFQSGPTIALRNSVITLWEERTFSEFWLTLIIRFLVLLFLVGIPFNLFVRCGIPRSQPGVEHESVKEDVPD